MNYSCFDKLLFRSPLLSYETLKQYCSNEVNLKEAYKNSILQEALFIASPVLHSEMLKWQQGILVDKKEIEKLIDSLMRYFLRMTTRPTPFGLFAGCSIAELSNKTSIILEDIKKYKKHTRLDMFYLCNLAQDLAKHSIIKEQLTYYPNSSIYTYGEQLRYVEYSFVNKKRIHHIIAVNNSNYLQKALTKANNGATVKELAACIVDNEVTNEEAQNFIEELVASQVLVNSLEPAITGIEFLPQLLETLNKNANDDLTDLKNTLYNFEEQIKKINQSAIGFDVKHYIDFAEQIKQLQTPYELGLLFQTDMIKPVVVAQLNETIAEDVWKGVEVLSKFSSMPQQTNLSKFQEAFYDRYETKEVSLLQALDKENGIGYLQSGGSSDLSPLVDDIALPSRAQDFQLNWTVIESFLLKKYIESVRNNAYEIILSDKELETLKTNTENLPDTLACMFNVIEGKTEKNERETIHIISAGGSSAANLLGRFCHSDEKILELTKAITQKEKDLNPDVIFAEIIHLPESRIGNILLRPVLRDYEIPYLAKASVDSEYQIALSDLMLSVSNNRLFLRSKKLNKEIIPRLSTAHNYSFNAQPVYQFLCDLQSQGKKSGVGFSWGALSNEYNFLPRVTYKNIILELATWNLKKDDFEILLKTKNEDLNKTVGEWRINYKIPQHIVLADGDNELVIDLENNLCIKTFISTIKKRRSIKLIEFLFNPETAVVKSNEGSYVNQFILAFYKNNEVTTSPNAIDKSKEKILGEVNEILSGKQKNELPARTFIIGEEWLYLKFYSGTKTSDVILTQIIKPLTEQLLEEQAIDKWFFIRYGDPKEHLRVRFHSNNKKFIVRIIELLSEQAQNYVEQGLIWKIQVDSYQREIERYGEDAIELTETLFFFDSVAVVGLIDMIEGADGELIRWLIALRSVDKLLDDFGYNCQEKFSLIELLRDNFGREFGMNKYLKLQLDDKYRASRKEIENGLDYENDNKSELLSIYQVFEKRSENNSMIVERIKKQTNKDSLNNRMGSYLHMNINRIFKSKQRIHELVIYDFLQRYYKSKLARDKSKQKEDTLTTK